MAIVKKISELTPKDSALSNTDLLVVGVDNGTDYDLKSVTGAQLLGTVVSQTITDSVTTKSPSENVVFDALALKVDKVTGSRLITSAESTLLGNTSGTNTGDQDLSGKVDKVVGKGLSTEDYTTVEKSKLAGLSGTNTGDQTLQTVTDKGSDTTNNMSTTSALYRSSFSPSTVKSATLIGGIYTSIDSDGKIQINTNGNYVGILKATNLASNVTLEIPNKTVGSYTIATTTDLTSKVDSNTSITGATKTKITYDSKGLVTSGADATTSDIADSLNKRYVTDANLTVIGNTSGTNTGDQIISDATITTTDITTNNFTTAKHGFVPKGTNVGNYLKDDGTWGAISAGGLTYFTEAQSTASPNATVNVDSLTAIASTTNADFAIIPKGTGAILGRIPDGTITGGNKRGTNAVDLQTFISNAANHVASGINSVVVGGSYNKATGLSSSVLGGSSNTAASSGDSVLGGDGNQAIGGFSIAGGRYSQANATTSVAFGYQCIVNGLDSSVAMGYGNTITGGYHSVALGGYNSCTGYSHVAFGESNTLTAPYGSAVLGINCLDNGYSRFVYGNQGWVKGDTQASKVVLNRRTTNATPTPLIIQTPNGAGEATNNQLTLKDNNSIRFKGTIIGRQSGSTNTSAWDIDGIIQRGVGVGTTTLLISNVNVVQNTPAWGTPTLTANTTLGCLTVNVTGATANIQWTCAIDTTEVIYA